MKVALTLIILLNLTNICLLKKHDAKKKSTHQHHVKEYNVTKKLSPESRSLSHDGLYCNRVCVTGRSMICEFYFEIEGYHTMSWQCGNCPVNLTDCYNEGCIPADGVPRAITVINRELPGPLIKVCKGDTVVVYVKNSLSSEATTIHWHGILQRGTQYNDGVPYVTQCPIQPGATFGYEFKVPEGGTYFYHSHIGVQRVDGVTGPLIVGVPDNENPLRNQYNYDLDEHILVIFDWDHELAIAKYEGAIHWINGTNTPNSMLVNGYGRNRTYQNIFTPTERFTVQQGKSYRFKLINSGNLDCPIQVSIDNHKLFVISSDGADFQPVEVDSITTLSGERYDFILYANQSVGLYWMKFRGLLQCGPEYNGAHQVAVIQYNGAPNGGYPPGNPSYADTIRQGVELNPLNDGPANTSTITLTELTAIDPVESILQGTPNFVYFVPYDLRSIYNPDFGTDQYPTPQIYNVSSMNLPFPLLSQRSMIQNSMLCNENTVSAGYCAQNYCRCPFVVKIPLNKLVEVILINEAREFEVNHPFHLHGYKFRVVALDRVGNSTSLEEVKRLYNNGQIKKNLQKAILKDTVNTPAGGYTVIRFHATNPGFWIFHCHIDHHVEEGMFFVFQVGDFYQMPPVPLNFPTCGDYIPFNFY